METILFIPGLTAPYTEDQYALMAREVSWTTNEFGVRHLSGVVINNSSKNLDWVRIEFILHNKQNLPVGTTSDCRIDFPSGESWKFFAPVSQPEVVASSEVLLSCEYGRVTRARQVTLPNGPNHSDPAVASARNGHHR
jgi:hypothetical protein